MNIFNIGGVLNKYIIAVAIISIHYFYNPNLHLLLIILSKPQ